MSDTSDRHATILQVHREFTDRLRSGRQARLREYYENALFYMGHQWITFDASLRGFRRMNLRPKTPQPVTNKYKALLDSVHAVLCRLEPSLAFKPGSDKDDDRLTADYGDMIISYLEKASNMPDLKLRLSKGLCLYDNMYAVSGYDPDGGDIEWVADWSCPTHPEKAYPADQAQQMGGMCPEPHGAGEDGTLVPDEARGQEVARGQNYTELATPFEMWVDYTIPLMTDQPKASVRRMRTREWVLARYDVDEEMVTDCPSDTGMTYLQSIMRLTPQGAFTGFAGTDRFTNTCVVDDFYCLPCKELPKGVFARILNDGTKVLEDIDYPFHQGRDGKPGRKFVPIAHFMFDEVPGAHLATGAADHLKSPQRRRNRLQAKIELHTARMANGVWWIPEGLDIKTPSGEEGTVIRGNPLAAGSEPKRLDGSRIPSTVVQQISQIDEEMSDIVGAYDIMKGERPPNIEAGYAISKLQEAAHGRQTSLFLRWERSHAEWARHQFYILRTNAPDDIFVQIKGEESRWRIHQIRAADLNGGVDIDVEPGSARPQSLLEKRAGIEQALKNGLINVADKTERIKTLRALGLAEMMPGVDADDEKVAREHDETVAYARQWYDEQGKPKVPPSQLPPFPVLIDPDLDPHDFHFERHRWWMESDEFRALPMAVQQIFRTGHEMQHLLRLQQQMAASQTAPAGGGQPPAGGTSNPESNGARGELKQAQGGGHAGRMERREVQPAAAQPAAA